MRRLISVGVGFAAGALAGYPIAYFVGKPLNPIQLGILLALSSVILIRHLVRRVSFVNQGASPERR